jgi:hypothetical protein
VDHVNFLLEALIVGGATVSLGSYYWVTENPHVSKVEWIASPSRNSIATAKVIIYLWYAPWVRRTAIVARKHGLSMWWYCTPDGEITDISVPYQLNWHMKRMAEKQESDDVKQAAENAKRKAKEREQSFWTSGDDFPSARLIDEDD